MLPQIHTLPKLFWRNFIPLNFFYQFAHCWRISQSQQVIKAIVRIIQVINNASYVSCGTNGEQADTCCYGYVTSIRGTVNLFASDKFSALWLTWNITLIVTETLFVNAGETQVYLHITLINTFKTHTFSFDLFWGVHPLIRWGQTPP